MFFFFYHLFYLVVGGVLFFLFLFFFSFFLPHFTRSIIPAFGGVVDSTSESEPEVVDSNFIGAMLCVFSAVVGRKKGAGSLRDPGVVVLGTSECDDSECGRSVFSKQICSFFLSETSDRFTRH